MDKKRVRVVVTFSLLILLGVVLGIIQYSLFGGITGYVVFDDSLNKLDGEVAEEIELKGKAEVIVTLEEGDYFSDVNIEENRIISEFSSGGFVAKVDKKDVIGLIRDKDVEYVEPVREFQISVDDAVDIVNAEDVWSFENGGVNMTGSGETVCVIDTGVDFSHADLIGKNRTGCNLNCINQICVEDCGETDLNGHGTHVAGIVSGVAKEAGLIGLKVFPGSGGGGATTTGIKNAIDWCVSNSGTHGISVISMSLGTLSLYSGYCDGSYPSFGISIDDAIENNISVVVASGNSGSGIERSTIAISSPACIESAIPVSATDKDDSISNYGHYSWFVELFAPGTSISSSCLGGGKCLKTGTSMSAPVVSGAIAILEGLIKLQGENFTPVKIEDKLNASGKEISDGSNVFSRIDIKQAILENENFVPNVSLVSPINGKLDLGENFNFSCEASDWGLKNITFFVWDSNGLVNESVLNVSGREANGNYSVSLSGGSYEWNCLAGDIGGNSAFSVSNYSFSVGGVSTLLISPNTNYYTNLDDVSFNCRAQSGDNDLDNVTLYLWDSDGLVYSSVEGVSGKDFAVEFNYSLSEEKSYDWNCLTYDNSSNSDLGDVNFSLIYDISEPDLKINSPENGTIFSEGNVKFIFDVTEAPNVYCDLIVESTNHNIDIVSGSLQGHSQTFSSGSYDWKISCSDFARNTVISLERSFIVSETQSSGGTGGGGGSGGSTGSSSDSGGSTVNSGGLEESSEVGNEEEDVTDDFGGGDSVDLTPEEENAEFVISEENAEVGNAESRNAGIVGRVIDNIVNNSEFTGLGLVIALVLFLIFVGVVVMRTHNKEMSIRIKHDLK
jgi:hypothetical protein